VRRLRVGGYDVAPLSAPAGAELIALPVGAQVTAPEPGPTALVRLPGNGELRHLRFAVRITP
jgi:hypothetical protein